MKEENKKCRSCGRFRRFYTKGHCSLQKEDIGFCSYHNKIVGEGEVCDRWNYCQRVRSMRKNMAMSAIVDIRNKLEVIEQILAEESELQKVKKQDESVGE